MTGQPLHNAIGKNLHLFILVHDFYVYYFLVWCDARTEDTVKKLIAKTPTNSQDFLKVSFITQIYENDCKIVLF